MNSPGLERWSDADLTEDIPEDFIDESEAEEEEEEDEDDDFWIVSSDLFSILSDIDEVGDRKERLWGWGSDAWSWLLSSWSRAETSSR